MEGQKGGERDWWEGGAGLSSQACELNKCTVPTLIKVCIYLMLCHCILKFLISLPRGLLLIGEVSWRPWHMLMCKGDIHSVGVCCLPLLLAHTQFRVLHKYRIPMGSQHLGVQWYWKQVQYKRVKSTAEKATLEAQGPQFPSESQLPWTQKGQQGSKAPKPHEPHHCLCALSYQSQLLSTLDAMTQKETKCLQLLCLLLSFHYSSVNGGGVGRTCVW